MIKHQFVLSPTICGASDVSCGQYWRQTERTEVYSFHLLKAEMGAVTFMALTSVQQLTVIIPVLQKNKQVLA